jgi:hypothetical protein
MESKSAIDNLRNIINKHFTNLNSDYDTGYTNGGIGGGGDSCASDDGVKYLYHGTSFFYIDSIIKNGLGNYPSNLFNNIKTYWNIIKNEINILTSSYIDWFINRNEKNISLSLTADLSVAKQYAEGPRVIGEGPINFKYALGDYLKTKKTGVHINDMNILYHLLDDASNYPSLILVIKVSDIKENLKYTNIKKQSWEITINSPIDADKLYIIPDDDINTLLNSQSIDSDISKRLIKLTSVEGKEYVHNTLKKFEQMKKKV